MKIEEYKAKHRAWTLYYLFERIHKDFITKSKGGTDSLGIKWKPLSPRTIASRPITVGDRRQYRLGSTSEGRGLLTPNEDIRWRGVYISALRRGATKAEAAKMAWGVLKKNGARTKINVLGNRSVPIMIVTRRLEKALRPGKVSGNRYIPPPNQIVNVDSSGQVTIQITIPYAEELNQVRQIAPNDLTPLLAEASKKATQHLKRGKR